MDMRGWQSESTHPALLQGSTPPATHILHVGVLVLRLGGREGLLNAQQFAERGHSRLRSGVNHAAFKRDDGAISAVARAQVDIPEL